MNVVVLKGGISKEREVSLRSGSAVEDALARRGHTVSSLDPQDFSFVQKLEALKPDAVFIALHGRYGEDGAVQGVLEWMGIPYTGSSVAASALCFDKRATKDVVGTHGVVTPDYEVYTPLDIFSDWKKKSALTLPVVVKPNTEGSSIGISRVTEAAQLEPALKEALRYDPLVLVETLIVGREVTVGVLEGQALTPVEVVPKSGFYDYQSKYTKGMTDYLVPARITPVQTALVQGVSEKIFRLLGLSGAVRADFIVTDEGVAHLLEVNTIPGMTETSLLPKAAAYEGMGFDELCDRILKSANLKLKKT